MKKLIVLMFLVNLMSCGSSEEVTSNKHMTQRNQSIVGDDLSEKTIKEVTETAIQGVGFDLAPETKAALIKDLNHFGLINANHTWLIDLNLDVSQVKSDFPRGAKQYLNRSLDIPSMFKSGIFYGDNIIFVTQELADQYSNVTGDKGYDELIELVENINQDNFTIEMARSLVPWSDVNHDEYLELKSNFDGVTYRIPLMSEIQHDTNNLPIIELVGKNPEGLSSRLALEYRNEKWSITLVVL